MGALILLACGGALAAPVGTFTQYRVTTAGSAPVAIALGPDGALWFTELQGNKIGRITPTGSITEFPNSTAGDQPQEIAAGPDGNMWFTEQGRVPAIARITPSGTITEFPIPTADAHPVGITAGLDGDMWFVEAAKIGRITPTGSITAFPIPTKDSLPAGIVAGPDHAMWFAEGGGNKIALVGTGPPAVKISRARISARHGAAAFTFHAIGIATGFRCGLAKRRKQHSHPRPRFSSCKSPKTYKHLDGGEYVFEVRALSATTSGAPDRKSFTIN